MGPFALNCQQQQHTHIHTHRHTHNTAKGSQGKKSHITCKGTKIRMNCNSCQKLCKQEDNRTIYKCQNEEFEI
jgi:hypothetical protein